MSVGRESATGPNMDLIDLETHNGIDIEIERYQFQNLDTKVRIRNDITIHYAGYFIKSKSEADKIIQSCSDHRYVDTPPATSPAPSPSKFSMTSTKLHSNPPKSPPKYRPRQNGDDTDADPVPLWRSDSVISLLEKEHRLTHFCSTWPQHGDKVLPGPISLTLGGAESPLVPSLIAALKDMLIGDIRLVYVPPAEVYGLDMTPVKRRLPPDEKISDNSKGVEERETDEREMGTEEEPVRKKKGKPEGYYSSSSDDDFDPDEEISEPWCDAPGTRGDRSTFFRSVDTREQQQQQQQLHKGEEVHRGLTGLLYLVQLLACGESVPEREIIHVKKPLETDKKAEKTEGGNTDK